ncbi:extracellular solute-binding protein [Arabiibacter massiliensis]|uniref:extracellular solute-binding protein n=1 Tax=Arabiibacter massiliensis TaxID=1870985 RepID=UPI0009B948EF|nr:extracellular solute-binding protein [Arabiibacter massiliensis]
MTQTTRRTARAARRWTLVLALVAALAGLGALAGCSEGGAGGEGSGDEEIVLTVSKRRVDMLPQGIMDEMVRRHPNLRFEFDVNANGNYSGQQILELEHHDIPDILVNTRNLDLTEDLENNLVDLAGYDFMSRYLPSVVDRLSMDGRVFYLPGYLTYSGLIYNKEMFAEHGWELPRSLEDLIALNEQAKAEGIRLLSYSLDLPGSRFLHLTNIASAQFIHTPQGIDWERRFLAGEAAMTGVFEPYMDEFQLWLDAGLITADDLSLTAQDSTKLFASGQAAMCYGLSSSVSANDFDFEAGVAPFLAKGEGQENAWYFYWTSGLYGINKKLEEPGNEEKLAIALEMFEFMSTPEGQEILMGGAEGRYSSTKGTADDDDALLGDYADVVERNNLVEAATYATAALPGGNALGEFMQGQATSAEVLAACDDAMAESKSETQMGEKLGRVTRDLSKDETVRYFAEAFREHQGTDLGLMLPGGLPNGQLHVNGVCGRLYEGDFYSNQLTILLPYTNEPTTLATARISGAELRGLLESGQTFEQKGWTGDLLPFYYEVAGAEVSYDDAHKVTSLSVGGREVADGDEFTVTYLAGTVDEESVSDVQVTEHQPIGAATEYMAAHPDIG